LTVIPTRNGIKSFFICGPLARSTKEAKPFFDVCAYVAFVAHVVVNAVDDRRFLGIATVAFFTVVLPAAAVEPYVADDLARRLRPADVVATAPPHACCVIVIMMPCDDVLCYLSVSSRCRRASRFSRRDVVAFTSFPVRASSVLVASACVGAARSIRRRVRPNARPSPARTHRVRSFVRSVGRLEGGQGGIFLSHDSSI
jgi:hypothetical protein